jgi:hypothetical protein
MVIPVVKALRVFDGKALAMGLAWKVMYELRTHIQSFTQPPFHLELDLAEQSSRKLPRQMEVDED